MTQGESKLSRKIMLELRAKGYFCFKVHGSVHMMAGLPDIIVCAKGKFIGLETKRPGEHGATRARQDFVHGQIRAAGGVVGIPISVEQAMDIVARALSSGAG